MPVSLDKIRELLAVEYRNLVGALQLSELPLDVYEVPEDPSATKTAFGNSWMNATPGYTPSHIVLPMLTGDLANWSAVAPQFPPTTLARHPHEWPVWRVELWHEVAHQYQHEVLRSWDPKDGKEGHGPGWRETLAAMANHFGFRVDSFIILIA